MEMKDLLRLNLSLFKINEAGEIGVSAISLWEIAKLVENGKLELPVSLEKWFTQALNYPGVQVIELTPAIATESTRLPGEFHRDPADQIIVATARIMKCKLVTSDEKILNYPDNPGDSSTGGFQTIRQQGQN